MQNDPYFFQLVSDIESKTTFSTPQTSLVTVYPDSERYLSAQATLNMIE